MISDFYATMAEWIKDISPWEVILHCPNGHFLHAPGFGFKCDKEETLYLLDQCYEKIRKKVEAEYEEIIAAEVEL